MSLVNLSYLVRLYVVAAFAGICSSVIDNDVMYCFGEVVHVYFYVKHASFSFAVYVCSNITGQIFMTSP